MISKDTKEDYDAARPDMDMAIQSVDFRSLAASMEFYPGSPMVLTA
jgi:hypothetical protein